MSFAVLLNNRLISEYRREGKLSIEPWEPGNLQIAQYALTPALILEETGDGEVIHDLTVADYTFKPNEYAKVVIKQSIAMHGQMVGRFLSASGLVEAGFALISGGKLDAGYGAGGEKIEFGLKNLRDRKNVFSISANSTSRLAYIEFIDLTQLPSEPSEMRAYDYYIRESRKLNAEEILPSED